MLKKTITYKDFNDEEVSEDFYFNLSKAELVELEMSHEGGLSESLQKIIAAEDGKGIITEFKNIILTAYGKRSDDGKRFIKNQTLREEFESTEAYSVLFMELITETDKAIEFVNGVIPKDMSAEVSKLTEAQSENNAEPKLNVVPPPEPKTVLRKDLVEMSKEQFAEILQGVARGDVTISE